MKTVLAILGKSGSGKDTLCNFLEQQEIHRIKRFSTRPMRDGESQGNPYLFVDKDSLCNDFLDNQNNYLEMNFFGEWAYATHIDSLEKDINVGAFDEDAVEQMVEFMSLQEIEGAIAYESKKIRVIPIFLEVPAKTRIIRQLSREEFPDIESILERCIDEKNKYTYLDEYNILSGESTVEENFEKIKKILDKFNLV